MIANVANFTLLISAQLMSRDFRLTLRLIAESEKPPLNERHGLRAAHDDVIQHAHVDEPQCILQFGCDSAIRLAGLRVSGRVVVCKDDSRRIALERVPHDLAWMDGSTVKRASEQNVEAEHGVSVIEENGSEHLVFEQSELFDQVGACGRWVGHERLAVEPRFT